MLELDSQFQKKIKLSHFSDFMQITGEIYRNVDNRKTLRFELNSKGYFIKQHFGCGWKDIFKNLSQLKWPIISAKNEYLAIQALKRLDIHTMDVLGFGQQGLNPARQQSFLITAEIDHSLSLEDYCQNWKQTPPDVINKRALIQSVAQIARTLHNNGINHRDFYICHFLLKKSEIGSRNPQLFVIDLHRTQIRNKVPLRWQIKDLSALFFSAMHIGLTQRDLFRFIIAYRRQTLKSIWQTEKTFWTQVHNKALQLNNKPESKKKR